MLQVLLLVVEVVPVVREIHQKSVDMVVQDYR
jgi:hypothetical protein